MMPELVDKENVDDEIYECLNIEHPKSFFLFAGAGSGKTRSLVEVLKRFRKTNVHKMQLNGQHVAIITYTNAACDEIKRRLEFDPTFNVSTIHSFAWALIKPYFDDIKIWVRSNLEKEIADLDEKLAKAKNKNTKTALANKVKQESKIKRLRGIDHISSFSYSPSGVNNSRDSLNHAEVIKIASNFLSERILMRNVLVRKFPILLIDESQDTKKDLIEALFHTQAEQHLCFCLGLFGDTMQRIYADGMQELGRNIPKSWSKPAKTINYRCPPRVVKLINKIRSDVDEQQQVAFRTDDDGFVRLFIIDADSKLDKFSIEIEISKKMSEITSDTHWLDDNKIKTLTLEHHMAANRGGFAELFIPLYSVSSFSTGLLDGSLRGMTFFTQQILPLVHATRAEDDFATAQIIRTHSPLLSRHQLQKSESQLEQIRLSEKSVNSIKSLWQDGKNPTLRIILEEVVNSGLFTIPDVLLPLVDTGIIEQDDLAIENESESYQDERLDAWESALLAPLSQLESYSNYISDNSGFGTHQGVKGLEFPRVMVILDDSEARGFLFSYEKLFGAKAPTPADIKNESEGKDTGVDRTRRLFYVTCSRAEKSLAIIAYTKSPELVKKYALKHDWFSEDEIIDTI